MSSEPLEDQLRVLASNVQIVGVHYNELRAKSEQIAEDELVAPSFRLGVLIEDAPPEDTPDVLRFHVSLNVEVSVPQGKVCVEPVMTFQVPAEHAASVNPRSATAFVNESGITHILPFARQALIDLSTRVFRAPVVMPIFGPDELQFELPPSDYQAAKSE